MFTAIKILPQDHKNSIYYGKYKYFFILRCGWKYCKMFIRIILLSTQFLKYKFHLILFLFKNLHIYLLSSSKNYEGKELVEVPNYLNWINFSRNPSNINDSPIIITYINIRLSYLYFLLQKDILNYRDISYIFFFNHSLVYFLINVYSDLLQLTLKYLKDTKVNINNVLIMTDDFNIRDCS